MTNYIKGFLSDYISKECLVDCPVQFTKDNINKRWYHNIYEENEPWTLLELVSAYCLVNTCKQSKIITEILELGGKITDGVLSALQPRHYKQILEYGFNPNCYKIPFLQCALSKYAEVNEMYLLIDYGAKIPKQWERIINAPILRQVEEYALLSDRRASSCRQTLLALIRVCRGSTLRPLRGVILEIAKQVWRLRGGEGCGARGHLWGLQWI